MKKVLRGYAKGKDGDLILIGTIPVPHSKDKPSPRERQDKRHLIRQGATIFKGKFFVRRAIGKHDETGNQGMGVARLTDLPPEWSRQHEMLGLPSPDPAFEPSFRQHQSPL